MDICNNHSLRPSTGWPKVTRYEVFLSFRGEDIRGGFIDFLYEGLADSGIIAFIDYDGIEKGEVIMAKIFQVIGDSEICIPIFSKDFASSKSCLEEVAEMVKCRRTIMPIFYDVNPSVVGKHLESYQQSFSQHAAKGVTSATIDKWKEALQIVSGMLGWDLEKLKCGQSKLIKEVVSTVRRLLRKDDIAVTPYLVGMDHPLQEVMKKLDVRYENGKVIEGQMLTGKRVVEISGLSGIGKSTLATVVCEKIYSLFEGWSFLDNIHGMVEDGRLLYLQEHLIGRLQKKTRTLRSPAEGTEFIKYQFRNMRVLIILDDVSDFEQIKSLAEDPIWFGPGSRIIVISRSRGLVDQYNQASGIVNGCDDILIERYELEKMNDGDSFQLFCKHALRGKPPPQELSSLARKISLAAEGNPFVIQAVGSSLCQQPKKQWEEAIDRLSHGPLIEKIKPALMKRYEDLEKNGRKIFLDIACFFTGRDKTISTYMWEACNYHPYTQITELQKKSLVTVTENNLLLMHNQVKLLGKEIVEEESPRRPSQRSRLWNEEDIKRVLNEDTVATVEALSATFDDPHLFARSRFFHNFSNLIYLEMNCPILKTHKQTARNFGVGLFLPLLKWLEWQRCLKISILLALNLSNLVYLNLSGSSSTNWRCWRQIIKKAKNLKVLILKDCRWLPKSPVSHAPVNLERLSLERCAILPPLVMRSISKLRKLVSLDIKSCSFVQELPEGIGYLETLKELYIDGTSIRAIDIPEGSYGKLETLSACNSKILSLPDRIGNLKSLSYLALDYTELSELPYSIGLLENLQTLSLRNCETLWKLPDSIGNLKELQLMDLSHTLVDELPSSVKDLRNLKVLKMVHTFLREFPGGIKNLESLQEIDFSDCRNLKGECNIIGLSSLRVLLIQNTDISELIVMDHLYPNLQNLRRDGNVHISAIGTTKEAQHVINGCETTTLLQADGHHISMQMMISDRSKVAVRQKQERSRGTRFG